MVCHKVLSLDHFYSSYVNDLKKASTILDPIMFADDTNLFYSHSNIKTLYKTVNEELQKLSSWFQANRLSLNIIKTKYTFFHRLSQNDNIPLVLPGYSINGTDIKRKVRLSSSVLCWMKTLLGKIIFTQLKTKYLKILGFYLKLNLY